MLQLIQRMIALILNIWPKRKAADGRPSLLSFLSFEARRRRAKDGRQGWGGQVFPLVLREPESEEWRTSRAVFEKAVHVNKIPFKTS